MKSKHLTNSKTKENLTFLAYFLVDAWNGLEMSFEDLIKVEFTVLASYNLSFSFRDASLQILYSKRAQ